VAEDKVEEEGWAQIVSGVKYCIFKKRSQRLTEVHHDITKSSLPLG